MSRSIHVMKKAEAKRLAIAEKLANHLLSKGLNGASLRQMAQAAETSDRMLLHYFADKNELMTQTLKLIADRFLALLTSAQPLQIPYEHLVRHLSEMVHQPEVKPYLRLWLDLAASSAGGNEIHREIAKRVFHDYFEWVAKALKVEREEERIPLAALAVATVEGFVMMDACDSASFIPFALRGLWPR
jgi:AcrR family transcriptional regulator